MGKPRNESAKETASESESEPEPDAANVHIRRYEARRRQSESEPLTEIEGIDGNEFGVGNDADLSRLALDTRKRKEAKEAKNATFGGFKVRPNYRYRLDDGRIGQCRYIGHPLFAKTSEKWIGMVIEFNGEGEHDGSVQNKSYFRCRDGKGVFVRPFRLIEDLGINTIQLTPRQIEGPSDDNIRRQMASGKVEAHGVDHPYSMRSGTGSGSGSGSNAKPRSKSKSNRRRNKRAQSLTTNLNSDGKWKPPTWTNEVDLDHGYDFLEQKPFYPKKDRVRNGKHKNTASLTTYSRKSRH